MKALTLIPKNIKKEYKISKYKNGIDISSPVYININFDDRFEIVNNSITVKIRNNRCSITLWKKTFLMHVTIFK
jgi:hypothetical protein